MMARDAVVDELTFAACADNKQRRHFALGDGVGKLDEHLTTIIKNPQRPPRWFIAVDAVVEMEGGDINAGGNRRAAECCRVGAA